MKLTLFKETETGYTLSTRLKMSLFQLQQLADLKVGDFLDIKVINDVITFSKNGRVIGEADEKVAPEMLKVYDHYLNTIIQSIHPQFGVVVNYNVSSIKEPTLSLEEVDKKNEKENRRKERRFKWHDVNHFSLFRSILYLASLILSLLALFYAITISQRNMIVLMGLVSLSSLYLILDQIRLLNKERNHHDED